MESLLSWAVSKGARINKLKPEARHFVVEEDVRAGDTLIAVPQALLLHAELAFQDAEYGAAFRQLAAELGPLAKDTRHLLCVFLVLEKARGDASVWAPYVRILPEEYDDPYWWTDEQIGLVRGTRLSRAIAAHYPGLQQIWSSLQRLEQLYSASQPPSARPSVLRTFRGGWPLKLLAARWARSAVWSRAFTVRRLANGARDVVALIPVLDMIDHSPAVDVLWHTGPDGTEPFQFTPLAPAPQGTVMHNNYGRKPSEELLLAYGFLLDGPNPEDHLVVSLAHSRVGGDGAIGSAAPPPPRLPPHPPPPPGAPALDPDGGEDPGEEELAAHQASAEDVQRSLALLKLGLSVEQRLSAADPLPPGLLLAAQLCLLPVSQLYGWAAQLQAARHLQQGAPPERGSAGGAPPSLPQPTAAQCNGGPAPGPQPDAGGALQGAAGAVSTAPMDIDGGVLPQGDGIGNDHAWPGRKRNWQQQSDGASDGVAAPGGESTADGGADDTRRTRQRLVAALLGAESAMHIPGQPNGKLGEQLETAVAPGSVLLGATGLQADAALAPNHTTRQRLQGPTVHMVHKLQALVSMRQQLTERLDCMANGAVIEAARAHGAQPKGTAPRAAAGSPAHSALAVAYVDVQKWLIGLSLSAVGAHVGSAVHAASSLLSRAVQQRLISFRPLSASRGAQYLPPGTAGVQGLADASLSPNQNGTALPPQPPSSPAWSSIDPDLHALHYMAWLRSWGLAREGPSEPGGATSAPSSGQPALAGALQEVVYSRASPPHFLARRASREILMQPDEPPRGSTGPSTPVSSNAKPTNGRARGPPSASRTFTMKGALKPAGNAGAETAPTANGKAQPASPAPSAMKRVMVPQGLAVSLGVDSDHDPVALGVVTTRGVAAGEAALRVPLAACLAAPSRAALMASLLAAAHTLLLELVAVIRPVLAGLPGSTGANLAAARVTMSRPHHMLVWHLLHCVAAAPCARLYASDVEGVQLLAEMLEDSPAAGSYQGAVDSLRSEFNVLRKALAMGELRATGEDPVLLRLLASSAAFNLFLWARQVVDRCAVQLHAPAPPAAAAAAGCESSPGNGITAAGASSSASIPSGGKLWVLAPVLSAVCAEVRDAALVPELVWTAASPGTSTGNGVTQGDQPTASIVVRAACELGPGLHLSPLILLPGLDTEELMLGWGPEALPWQQLLHVAAAAPACRRAGANSSGGSVSSGGLAASSGGSAKPADGQDDEGQLLLAPFPSRAAELAHAVGVMQSRTVMYELYICPGERDPLSADKLALLVATGLGCVHYLSIDLSTEHMLMCALKICLGTRDLVGHPLARRCVELHAAARAAGHANAAASTPHDQQPTPRPGVADTAGSVPLLGPVGLGLAPSTGAEAPGSPGSFSTGEAAYQALAEVQPAFLDVLSGLPDDQPVCRAARKQLRQMVHDARKNTRRRLKQLEAVHNVVSNHVANASGGNSGGSGGGLLGVRGLVLGGVGAVGGLGGAYHVLGGSSSMHEGVRLYLASVCDVLDTWADHLGLNRQSDSMTKRHKGRHDDP